MLVGRVRRSRLGAVEEIRVIATFSKLHQNVEQTKLIGFSGVVYHVDVLHKDSGVPLEGKDEDES